LGVGYGQPLPRVALEVASVPHGEEWAGDREAPVGQRNQRAAPIAA
jgi:hypothetical protein